MAAPTFQFDESNGAGETNTANVTSIVYAAADSNSNTSNLATNNPVVAGNNSYEKWNKIECTGAASNSLSAFGVYWGADPTDQGSVSTNIKMYFTTNHAYATPVATASSIATTRTNTQSAGPGTSLTAPANSSGSKSAYITSQMQTLSGAIGGNVTFPNPWMTVQYTYNALVGSMFVSAAVIAHLFTHLRA